MDVDETLISAYPLEKEDPLKNILIKQTLSFLLSLVYLSLLTQNIKYQIIFKNLDCEI